MQFRASKIVSSLPVTLEANTIYLVRVGTGFDLYCTDATGSVAHEVNKQLLSPLSSLLNLEIFGNYEVGRYYDNQNFMISPTSGDGTNSQNLTSNLLYLFPFYISKNTNIDRLGITVNNVSTTAQMKIGLYSSSKNVLSLKVPDTLVDIATTGFKEITLSPIISLLASELHYGALIVNSNPLDCLRSFFPLLSFGKPTSTPNSVFRRCTRLFVNHTFSASFPSTINQSSLKVPDSSFEITHPLFSFRIA